jgi:hypothetical protein
VQNLGSQCQFPDLQFSSKFQCKLL